MEQEVLNEEVALREVSSWSILRPDTFLRSANFLSGRFFRFVRGPQLVLEVERWPHALAYRPSATEARLTRSQDQSSIPWIGLQRVPGLT